MVAGQIRRSYDSTSTNRSNFGTLLRISQGGVIRWKREYSYLGDSMEYHIYDMKQTSDGGFIMAGEATDLFPPYTYPMQQAWLLKVDSNGCMSPTDPQCHPTAVKNPASVLEFTVYPNPAKSILYVRGAATGVFSLHDVSGRELLQSTLQAGKRNELKISSLSAGVYFYTIQTLSGRQRGKLVIE
ncbi:MAG: T9SS type A sorting domain-containing protein [Bacteroidetes bacterium]|nr:T9SS type A sorting domain-containing protein [Bacteroidota bacterium]